MSREQLKPGFGTVRFITPAPDNGRGGTGAVRGGLPGAQGRGGPGRFGGGSPPNSPYSRPDYAYKANEWNPLEIILDANYLRAWVNDGPEAGTTNGQADEDIARYGPVALYVGGTGEVRFKQIELKDLGKRFTPDEKVSRQVPHAAHQRFLHGWSVAVADINRDGMLDMLAGPFYYLGPDYRSLARSIPARTTIPAPSIRGPHGRTSPTTTPAMAGRTYVVASGADVAVRQSQRRTAPMGPIQRAAHDHCRDCHLQRHRR